MIKRSELIQKLNDDFRNYDILFTTYKDTNMITIIINNIYVTNDSFSHLFYRRLEEILKSYGVSRIDWNNIKNTFWSSEIEND